jgi:hypothetical protein
MITKDRKTTIDHDLVVGHTYEVVVRAISADGRMEAVEVAPKSTVTLLGVTKAPTVPSALAATPFLSTIFLTWTNPTDSDFDVTEVWRHTVDSRMGASKIGEMRTDSFADNIGSPGATRYYWIRSRNTSGVVSEWNADLGVEATTLAVAATDIADFAITATKMFTNTVILTGDSWADHSPTAPHVAWNAHTIVYGGASYAISAGDTHDAYIYWVAGAATYSTSASHPTLGNTGFMIATNTAGVHTKVWNSSANMVIGTAFIADLAVTDAKIANLSAAKINAGTLAVGYTEAKCTNAAADQTNAVLQAGTTITGGGIVLSGGGSIHTINKDGCADTTAGVWMGFEGAAYTLGVGDATKFIIWDGSALTVQGMIQTAASGARVVLNPATNAVELFLASDTVTPTINITTSSTGSINIGWVSATEHTENTPGVSKYYSATPSKKLFITNWYDGEGWNETAFVTAYGEACFDNGVYTTSVGFYVDSVKVVGARIVDARADDAVTSTWSATEAGVLDALRDAMIAHGLIAAA